MAAILLQPVPQFAPPAQQARLGGGQRNPQLLRHFRHRQLIHFAQHQSVAQNRRNPADFAAVGKRRRQKTFAVVRAAERLRFPDRADAPTPSYFFECLAFAAPDKGLQAYVRNSRRVSRLRCGSTSTRARNWCSFCEARWASASRGKSGCWNPATACTSIRRSRTPAAVWSRVWPEPWSSPRRRAYST